MKRLQKTVVLLLLSVSCTISLSAQVQHNDTLQFFNYFKEVHSIDISPSGRVVIASVDEMYVANSLFEPLKSINILPLDMIRMIEGGPRSANKTKVKFFNTDTIIAAGGFCSKDTNYYYLSYDGGNKWKYKILQNSKPYTNIEQIFTNIKGECILKAKDGDVFYSADFGKTFEQKDSSFQIDYDTSCVDFITDNSRRIAVKNPQNQYIYLYDEDLINEDEIASKKIGNTIWGIDKEDGLYYKTKDTIGNSLWHRYDILPFYIKDIYSFDKKHIVISDGRKNYLYNLKSKVIKEYFYKNPLKHFLHSDIQRIEVVMGSAGCRHGKDDTIILIAKGDSLYCGDKAISRQEIMSALRNLNRNYDKNPKKSDFTITNRHIDEYKSFINNEISEQREDGFGFSEQDSLYYVDFIIKQFDTVSEETFRSFIRNVEDARMTTYRWIGFNIINSQGDKLFICHDYFRYPNPYLTMSFVYNAKEDKGFTSYNIDFAKTLSKLLPEEFNIYFTEIYLVRKLAQWLREGDEYRF